MAQSYLKVQLILLFLLIAVFELAFGQTKIIEKNIPIDENQWVELNLKFGDMIKVESWDRKEVSFRAAININSGRFNDALVVDFNEISSGIIINTDYNHEEMKYGRPEDCPEKNYTSYNWNNNSTSVVCSRINYEIRVPEDTDIRIETISSDIELKGTSGPVRAKSISGFIDLSWFEHWGADISVKTVSGDAFTDLENISFRNKMKTPPMVGYELKGTIGQGGPIIKLESISGDIYLRKMKN